MTSKEALECLRTIIGEENYQEVVKQLAGATVYFPEDFEWSSKASRNDKIREDFYSGKFEITDLAKKYDLSISTIYKIVQKRT